MPAITRVHHRQRSVSQRSRTLVMLVLAATVPCGAAALAANEHTAGFSRYARVERSDGSYREMLIDEASLAALRAGAGLGEGATILMESYYRPGEIGTVFAKQFNGGRWLYGSFRPGGSPASFAPRPQCAGCHLRAQDHRGGTFTGPMLNAFAATDTVQETVCDRPGRTPCSPEIYATGKSR
ncbi:hypothetical protein [Mesorhizobium xinjiangense]|uniref:hypothetical protein n=1 Tax=Mesorhizobium xinjiangense TaxID=2678685 RepID=UPI0012ED6E48|nr:hypothetical protein [Mesorhizobium xinjiangense]